MQKRCQDPAFLDSVVQVASSMGACARVVLFYLLASVRVTSCSSRGPSAFYLFSWLHLCLDKKKNALALMVVIIKLLYACMSINFQRVLKECWIAVRFWEVLDWFCLTFGSSFQRGSFNEDPAISHHQPSKDQSIRAMVCRRVCKGSPRFMWGFKAKQQGGPT